MWMISSRLNGTPSFVSDQHDMGECCRQATMKHAMNCLARLIRVLLGPKSVAESKLDYGATLVILGVEVAVHEHGFTCRPAPGKVQKWILESSHALKANKLTAGHASKLAGKLSWGCSHMFIRVGRAVLRSLFDQITRRDSKMSDELKASLRWWKAVLVAGISETKSMGSSTGWRCSPVLKCCQHPGRAGGGVAD